MEAERKAASRDAARASSDRVLVVSLVVMILIAIAGIAVFGQVPEDPAAVSKTPRMTIGDVPVEDPMDEVPVTGEEPEVTEEAAVGSYEPYDASGIAATEGDKTLLFFSASWCPTCRDLDADIRNRADDIPAGVTILSVDYDLYPELRERYGVTIQHTLVQVTADGTEITKWVGGANLGDILWKLK